MSGGLAEHINERRAKAGLNKLDDGSTGKGDAPRLSNRPSWVGLEEISRDEKHVKFKTGIASYRQVRVEDVEVWEKRLKKNKRC